MTKKTAHTSQEGNNVPPEKLNEDNDNSTITKSLENCPDLIIEKDDDNKEIDNKFRSRLICFTFYDDHHNLPKINCNEFWDWMLYGMEVCPKTKRMHYQGVVHFIEKHTWTSAGKLFKKLWDKHANCFTCKGNVKQNETYCSKGGIVYEWGIKPSHGNRYELIDLKNQLINKEITLREIILNNPYMYHTFGRTLERIVYEINYDPNIWRTWETIGTYIFGKTGLGKSSFWRKNYNPKIMFKITNDVLKKGWWDGYINQEIVVFDEARENDIPYQEIFQLVSGDPHQVPIRGKPPIQFLAKQFIITSSLHPKQLFKLNENESWEQWNRRFKTFEIQNDKSLKEIIINDDKIYDHSLLDKKN